MPEPPAPKRRGRIIITLLLLLFLVGVVPLLWTSFTLVSRSRETLELDQKQMQQGTAKGLSQQAAVYVGSLAEQLTVIARALEVDPSARGLSFGERVARIRKTGGLERFVDETSPFLYLSVVDTQGVGARSGVQLPEPIIEQQLQEGWMRGLQGQPMINYPVLSQSLQEPVLVLAEPIRAGGPESEVVGAVLAVASLGPLWKRTREAGQGIFDVYIVDSRGWLIAHSDPEKLSGPPDVSDIEIVRLFLATRGRFSQTVPFDLGGRRMLGTYVGVEVTGWGVIVQVEEEKAYFVVGEMRRDSFLLVGGVTLATVLLGFVFAGEISRPIRELARSARRLASGEYGTRVHVQSRNEVGVLADAFNHMGGEIEKSILEIQKAAETNKELFIGSIKMLANAIDEKDPYTRGHSERVAYYSMVIAKHLGMTEEEVERVYLSGIIHDVGKIGIEDKILRKPAALTDDEYEIMKQHPTKGAHILEAVPMLKAMAGAGLQHHENIDGSGYPEGLKGDQIPLLGRIVSVADAFDAMTTDRPYSKAMTFEAALARLRFLADKKFDPDCVTAMEKAAAAGDLSTAKARRASVASRQMSGPPAETPASKVG